MKDWDFLNDMITAYGLDLFIDDDHALISDRESGRKIEVFEEKFYNREKTEEYVEYIVCFATQHLHCEEDGDAADYIRRILDDEVLPVEFYKDGERRFGGEIERSDFDKISKEFLVQRFFCTPEYISQFEFEVHSWSGKYDIKRRGF